MKLRQIIQTAAATLVVALGLAVPLTVVGDGAVAHAAPTSLKNGATGSQPTGAKADIVPLIKQVGNILLFIVGAASVIIIIIGGLRYVTSAGDSNAVNGAKNTILYAVVGLVVASMAYAIVNFIIPAF